VEVHLRGLDLFVSQPQRDHGRVDTRCATESVRAALPSFGLGTSTSVLAPALDARAPAQISSNESIGLSRSRRSSKGAIRMHGRDLHRHDPG
jgi:hypothetical protein